jgi:hypothetical protein
MAEPARSAPPFTYPAKHARFRKIVILFSERNPMRAESQTLVDEIKQSLELLRRHL